MMRRTYRGHEIESHGSGWFSAFVLVPSGEYYVTVRADTVHGCRRMIANVLNGRLS